MGDVHRSSEPSGDKKFTRKRPLEKGQEKVRSPKRRFISPEKSFEPKSGESQELRAERKKDSKVRLFPSEEEYCRWQAQSGEMFKKYQETLEHGVDFVGTSTNDAEVKYDKAMLMLSDLYKEVCYVENQLPKKDNYIPAILANNFSRIYNHYKENRQQNFTSNAKYLNIYFESVFNQMIQLQRSSALLADFTLVTDFTSNKSKLDYRYIILNQFVERIKASERGEQKSERLQLYQQCLLEYKQRFEDLQTSLKAVRDSYIRGEEVHVSPLFYKCIHYGKSMMAIGSLIKKDCSLLLDEEISKNSLDTLGGDYEKALRNYVGLKEQDQDLPGVQRTSNALDKLSIAVEKAEALRDYLREC